MNNNKRNVTHFYNSSFFRSAGQEVASANQTDAPAQQRKTKTKTPATWKWCRKAWSFHRQTGLTSCYCRATTRARLDTHHLTYLSAIPWHHTCIPLIATYHRCLYTSECDGHWTCIQKLYIHTRDGQYQHKHAVSTSMTSHKHTLSKTVTLFIPYHVFFCNLR